MSHGLEPGFGATLAAAREAKGLTRSEVAERLKLSLRQIEALETEDWTALPDPVFVRGFVRNYARLVGLDPETLISRREGAIMTKTITTPSTGVRLDRSPVAYWLIVPLLLAALFIGGVAALYTWLREGEDAMLPYDQDQKASEPVLVPIPVPVTPPASAPLPADATSSEAPQDAPAASMQAPVSTSPVPAPVSSTPQAATTNPAESEGSTEVALRFSTTEESWIQVVDSKGKRFAKLLHAGESVVVSGTPPFKLVVGNAAYVSLVYKGESIDLKPYIGERVARFTLE